MTERYKTGDLMSDGPAAEVCGVSRQALQRWRRERRGPPFIRIEGSVRYSRRALEEWLAARTVIPAHAVGEAHS